KDFENKKKDIFVLKGKEGGFLPNPIRIDNGEIKGSTYQMNDFLFKYKLKKNEDKRGINKCYCELKSSILPHILKNRLTP
ncbi:MAG: hypothetical protein AABW56_03525, partial [Nanoarchaeota archaeon]